MVDENGLPPQRVDRVTTSAEQVRFLYAGGKNRLKGVQWLHEATQLLPGDGWSLTAYGTEPATWPAAVTTEPSYDPARLSEVLHAHDVLVVPSLMRESYSILTREALQHGLTVITSDSLGPEEVVEHGVNGLVVATGDTAALAAAMTQLVDDRGLLARLRSADPPDRAIAGRPGRRPRAALRPPPPPAAKRAVNHVLFICGIQGAPLRYRAQLPAEALALVGVTSDVRRLPRSRARAARGEGRRGGALPGAGHDPGPAAHQGAERPRSLRRGRPDHRPGPAGRDPRAAAAAARGGRPLDGRGAPLPHHPRGVRRIHRQHPAPLRPHRSADGTSVVPVLQRGWGGDRTSGSMPRCGGRGSRGRCGSATSRGRRRTTATGSRSSRRCSR